MGSLERRLIADLRQTVESLKDRVAVLETSAGLADMHASRETYGAAAAVAEQDSRDEQEENGEETGDAPDAPGPAAP